jgi:hypothetical protein
MIILGALLVIGQLFVSRMSTPAISNADMIGIQLRKWIGKRRVQNVTLSPAYSHPSVPAGETVIAEVVDRRGQGLFFTGSGFTLPGRGFIRYDDITGAEWISSEPFPVKARRKREDYDHIELSLHDGTSLKLTDLEQAVFPLLHFFQWMTGRRKHDG